MKISFSTLASPDWSWHDVLHYGPQFGFNGVEIRLLSRETNLLQIADLQRDYWSQRRQELSDADFEVAGLASSVRFDAPSVADVKKQIEIGRRYVDLCHALGGRFIRVFGDLLPKDIPSARESMLKQVAAGLVELATYSADYDVQILMETHGDFSASAPCVEVMQLASHPYVGLVWDTHHPWRFHAELLYETWTRLRPWVRHVHWKDSVTLPDAATTPEAMDAAKAARRLMGGHQHADYVLFRGGEFPALECMRLLLGAGYTGWHSLEWEKMWHPELVGPEIALPLFPTKLKELEQMASVVTPVFPSERRT